MTFWEERFNNRKRNRWQKFCSWLREMDQRFLWKRVLLLCNPNSISKVEASRIHFPGVRIEICFVWMESAFMIYDIDHLPRRKYKALMAQIEAANRRSEEPQQ